MAISPKWAAPKNLAAAGNAAAGFISYEAAPAFDPAQVTHPQGALPLLWFGIYDLPTVPQKETTVDPEAGPAWHASQTEEEYAEAIDRVRELLASPAVVDLRNVYEPDAMARQGFRYWGVGR